MITDLLVACTGFIPAIAILLPIKRQKPAFIERLIIAGIAVLPLIVFVLWGVVRIGFESGSEWNILGLGISYTTSTTLIWLLVFILPAIISVLLLIFLRQKRWRYRIIASLLIGLFLVALNAFQLFMFHRKYGPYSREPDLCSSVRAEQASIIVCP